MKKAFLLLLLVAGVAHAELDGIRLESQTDFTTAAVTNETKALYGIVECLALDVGGSTNAITVVVSSTAGGSGVAQTLHTFTATADIKTNLTQDAFLLNDKIRAVYSVAALDGTNTYGTADASLTVIIQKD